MTKRKLTKHEDDVRRGLRTDQYNGIIDTQLKAIDELKAEVERLTLKATNIYNAMKIKMEADEVVCKSRAIILQQKSNDEVFNFVIKKLEAELDELRASSFVTAVSVEQYERVVKAGDALAVVIAYELRIDEGEELPICVQAWNAAKEGKQP